MTPEDTVEAVVTIGTMAVVSLAAAAGFPLVIGWCIGREIIHRVNQGLGNG
jgi:hypothetical protein